MNKRPVFQRRHYKALVNIIADIPYTDHQEAALNTFVEHLQRDNPKFDSRKFTQAVWEQVR